MSLLDLIVIAIVLVLCAVVPEFARYGVPLTVTLALIVERLLKGERI